MAKATEATAQSARDQIGLLTEAILRLEQQKNAAVDEEDFLTAARKKSAAAALKEEIELTKAKL